MSAMNERDMPVTTCTYSEMDRKWFVALPGGLSLPARDEVECSALVAKYAPYSSLRFVRNQEPPGAVRVPAGGA